MLRKVIAALVATIIFGTLTVKHSQAGAPAKPPTKGGKLEGSETGEQKKPGFELERETGNVSESLERIGRDKPELSPVREATQSLLTPNTPPPPKAGPGARRNIEIAERAGVAFQEIAAVNKSAPVDLAAGVVSTDPIIRENAFTTAAFLQSHDIVVQVAIARALLIEHVKSARRAAARALVEINPIDPKVLALIREAALESSDMSVRITALKILQNSYHFDIAAHELALRFKSRHRKDRAPVVELFRTIRGLGLLELFQQLTRGIPSDLMMKFLPELR